MQLGDILGALRRRWLFAVVPLVVALAAGLFVVTTAPVVYQARAQAYVALPFGNSANDLYQGSNYAQQQLTSYAALATTPAVLGPVIDELGLDTTPQKLAHDVQVTASSETVILEIAVRGASPQQVADIANAVTGELATVVSTLSPPLEGGKSSVEIVEIGSAVPPSAPISPDKKRDLAAAMLGGLFLAVLCAIARDKTDQKVRDWKDMPPGVNVLGTIPLDRSIKTHGPAALAESGAQRRGEAYRRVRTTLRFADVDNPVQVFAVTSALPGEGKSTSALNLAQVFASAGGRVLLVDADLRKPKIAEYLGIVGSVGLVDVLIGRARLDDVLQKVLDGKLTVLPAGAIPPNPTELLGSRSMAALLGVLRERFDVVVFDTPPLAPVVDAAVLAPLTDGAVVVSRFRRATRAQLAAAVESLDAVGTRVLGVLMTCASPDGAHRSGYGYYQESQPGGARAAARPATRAEARAAGAHGALLPSPVAAPAFPPPPAPEAEATNVLARVPATPAAVAFPAVGSADDPGPPPGPEPGARRPFRPAEAGPRSHRGRWSSVQEHLEAQEYDVAEIPDGEFPEDSTRPRRRARRAAP